MAESDPFVDTIEMRGEEAESGGGEGKDLDLNTELDKATKNMDQATAISLGGMWSPIFIQEDPSGGRVPKPAKFMPHATNPITSNGDSKPKDPPDQKAATPPAKTPVKNSVEMKSSPKSEQPNKCRKGKGKDMDTSEGSSDDLVEKTDDVMEDTHDRATSTKSRKRSGHGTESGGSAKKQKRTVTGVPEEPKGLRNTGIPVNAPFTTFTQYNGYTLYMNPNTTHVDQIPTSGIRLDDMTVAFVVKACGNRKLTECWPGEFDLKAMVRGRRLPLGHAAKEFKKEGDVDVDGNVLTKDQEGWYYLWLKGLHELCGQEGLDHKTYRKRPAFEEIRVPGLTWKISSRANVQFASGDPRDRIFARLKDYPTAASYSDAIIPSSSKTITGSQPDATTPKVDPKPQGNRQD